MVRNELFLSETFARESFKNKSNPGLVLFFFVKLLPFLVVNWLYGSSSSIKNLLTVGWLMTSNCKKEREEREKGKNRLLPFDVVTAHLIFK